jgi:hypothetical protein
MAQIAYPIRPSDAFIERAVALVKRSWGQAIAWSMTAIASDQRAGWHA